MGKKELTHLYTMSLLGPPVIIGVFHASTTTELELFAKTLPLTSDLKRLPFLLGINMTILTSPDIGGEIQVSGIAGYVATAVLLNGTYDGADFASIRNLLADERAKDDIIGITQGHFTDTDLNMNHSITNFAWDFEGEKVLYDTLSLILFVETDIAVSASDIENDMVTALVTMEIDWKPMSAKDVQEFIMEHIYARQGD